VIKVEQTEFDTPFRSNCLSACVASIFEIIDLNLFENVHDHRSLWRWLTHRFPAVGVISRNYVEMGVGDQIGDYVFTLNRPEKLAIHEFLT
jgi:hypothetical protein